MQVGSIVVMINPLRKEDINYLITRGYYDYPTPGDRTYEITMLEPSRFSKSGQIITLDAYPQLRSAHIAFGTNLFRELMAPGDFSVGQLLANIDKRILCLPTKRDSLLHRRGI